MKQIFETYFLALTKTYAGGEGTKHSALLRSEPNATFAAHIRRSSKKVLAYSVFEYAD